MPHRPRPLSEYDRAAWAEYITHIKALTGGKHQHAPPAAASKAQVASPLPPPAAKPAPARSSVRSGALITGQPPAGLDKATWGRFRAGKLPTARTLDLHGRTAQAAFHALQRFILTAHAEQVRCVEIITGRGSGEHGGVIRRELPHWLNLPALRPLILAASHPHPQNPGSTRLLLKRPK